MNTTQGPAARRQKAFHEYHLWSRSRIPQVLIFWFSSFMNTTKGFQAFHVKIVVNTIKNFQKSQWNPGHKIKKICAVFIEIPHWWFFAKNTAVTFYNVQITNLVAIASAPFNPHIYHPLHICLRRFNLILYFAVLRCQNKSPCLIECVISLLCSDYYCENSSWPSHLCETWDNPLFCSIYHW